MKIFVLSRSDRIYSTYRLKEEGLLRRHQMSIIDHTQSMVQLESGKHQLFIGNENITNKADAIIPRIGTSVIKHGAAIVKQFELNGVFSAARSLGIIRSKNKVRTLQIMARKRIPIPKTVFSVNPQSIDEQIDLLGGGPVIVKLQEGTQGLGVILAESRKTAKSILDTFYKMNTSIMLQEYIEEAKGEDIRMFVVGGKIVASIKRMSDKNEFRSNVHRGAKVESTETTLLEKKIAKSACHFLGLAVAGVDIIRSNRGPLLLEVNSSPGLQGIEEATEINIAKEIIIFLEKNVYKRKK